MHGGAGVGGSFYLQNDKNEQELYETVMMGHQTARDEDADDDDDWSFEREYVIVEQADAVIDKGAALPALTR